MALDESGRNPIVMVNNPFDPNALWDGNLDVDANGVPQDNSARSYAGQDIAFTTLRQTIFEPVPGGGPLQYQLRTNVSPAKVRFVLDQIFNTSQYGGFNADTPMTLVVDGMLRQQDNKVGPGANLAAARRALGSAFGWVVAHEFGHNLGLYDEYHYSNSALNLPGAATFMKTFNTLTVLPVHTQLINFALDDPEDTIDIGTAAGRTAVGDLANFVLSTHNLLVGQNWSEEGRRLTDVVDPDPESLLQRIFEYLWPHEHGHSPETGGEPGSGAASGAVIFETLDMAVGTFDDMTATGLEGPRSTSLSTLALTGAGTLTVGTGPLAIGVTNGSFGVGDPSSPQFGWMVTGDAGITGGQGVLAEDDRFLSGLAQSFLLPQRAEALTFTIVSADLRSNGHGPVDAFEVALLGEDDTPLVGTASLTGTDALFNLQSDGRAFAADRVTVSGLADRNGGLLDTRRPIQVAIDLTGLAPGAVAHLFFDLIGFGEVSSRVVIDDVRIVSVAGENLPPIAEGESATVRAGGAVVLDLLENDVEPDGEPMSVILVDGPAHGTLTDLGAGRYEYRPAAGYQGADAFTYRVSDGVATSDVVTVSLTVEGVNTPPQLGAIAPVNVVEGGLATVVLSATDPESDVLTWSLVNPPVSGATIDAATGEFRWTATDGDESYEFTVRVSDGGASTDAVLTVVVANAAPTLTVTGDAEALSGQPYTLSLAAADPGEDIVTEWIIDWGDGSAVERVAGGTASVSHVYAEPERTHTIQVSAIDEDGTWTAAPREVAVVNDRLYVRTLQGGDSGFALRFSRTFQQSLLNLYDTRLDPCGLPDLVLRDASGNGVRGSVVVDADGQGLRFVATGGALPAGEYTVQLASRDNGFVDALGRTLDGNRDNVSGDDFTGTFTVSAADAVVSVADVVRGPGQGVDIAATSHGIPVSFTSAGGATRVAFDLRYDPATLEVSVFEPGAGLPAGGDVVVTGVAGAYRITVTAAAPLAAGMVELLRVRATVPTTAIYGAARVLDIGDVSVDGVAGRGDDGVQVVALFGDSTGDQRYTNLDGQRVSRIVAGLDSGFGFYPAIDPIVISDVDRSGTLSAEDATIITHESQFVVGGNPVFDRPEIPPLPSALPMAGARTAAAAFASGGVFTVLSVTPTASGAQVRFDRPIDAASFDLGDVSLSGAVYGAQRGSVVLDADGQGFGFVRSGGVLPADSYTLTVRSGADGVRAAGGGTLDGNRDGTPGDAFTASFGVSAGAAVTVSIPDVVRGPGQDIVVPNGHKGGLHLPVRLSQAEGVTRLAFTLRFDPGLLDLRGVQLAPGFSGSLSRTTVPDGVRIEVRFDAPLTTGAASPMDLVARVAPDAPYGAAQVLDLADVDVDGADGAPVAARDDDAIQLAAYLLDADGDGRYSQADLHEMLAVLAGGGRFTGFPAIDPELIGDLNGNGQLTTLDTNRFQQFLAGQPRPEIPASPALPPVVKTAPASVAARTLLPPAPVAPTVAWHETWTAPAGTITVPVTSAPSAIGTPTQTDWTNAPWAKDLAQRTGEMRTGGTLRALLKALVRRL